MNYPQHREPMSARKSRSTISGTGKNRSAAKKRISRERLNHQNNSPPSKPRGFPSRKLLKNLLDFYGIQVSDEQALLLWEYHKLLRNHNTDSDLTRLHSFDSIVQRHYADCLLPEKYLTCKWPSPLLDIGSGAGLPGIILKIQSPSTRIILAEPRPRRVVFLNKVISELNLKNIEVFAHRVTQESFKMGINGCISRAFTSVEKTLDLTESLLRRGGKCILMKGPRAVQELGFLDPRPFKLSLKSFYSIPNTPQKRSLLVFQR